jgi:hypothetical protein
LEALLLLLAEDGVCFFWMLWRRCCLGVVDNDNDDDDDDGVAVLVAVAAFVWSGDGVDRWCCCMEEIVCVVVVVVVVGGFLGIV